MKKILIICMIGLGFTSCKKTYTCECTPIIPPGLTGNEPTITSKIESQSEVTAKANCTAKSAELANTHDANYSCVLK